MDVARPEPVNAERSRVLAAAAHEVMGGAEHEVDAPRPAGAPSPGLARPRLGGVTVQAKLDVGASDDPLEVEADAIALRTVEALRRTGAAENADPAAPETIDRRLTAMRHTDHAPSGPIGADGGELSSSVEAMLRRQSGSGQPLPDVTRRQMESAMDADFGAVRTHAGPEASALNQEISARAFTVDNHVFFRDGLPDTSSAAGQHLLAHELAHTVQQNPGAARRSTIRRDGDDDLKGGSSGGTGTMYMAPDGVGHDQPEGGTLPSGPGEAPKESSSRRRRRDKSSKPESETKTPGVLFMDPSGVGHKEPDKLKTPGVLHMDDKGVGHKAPDKSKTPGVLFMDPSGVGHKEVDKAPKLPSVLHMDDKGVGHDKADHVLPEVAGAHKALKTNHDLYLPCATAIKDTGAKWDGFKTTAEAQQLAADTALKAAQAVWDVEAPLSGLTAAQQAAAAKTASTAATKAKTDAQALVATYDANALKLAQQDKSLNDNTVRFAKDKVRWLKTASPLTKIAVDEIQGFLDAQSAARVEATAIKNSRAATLLAIDTAAADAAQLAAEAEEPLAKGGTTYAITGLMQQKLNIANGGPRLSITADFDVETEAALKKFQKAQGLPETGVADVATWTALNAAAPSETRNGELRVEDVDKSKTARPMAGIHPKLSFPTSGAAVRELQEHLNNWQGTIVGKKPFDAMSVDGLFGIKTRSAVKAFQKAHGLKQTAVVDDETWAELDKQGGVTGGTRQFDTRQIVEGMLTGMQARYDWEVTKDNRLVITVKINFTGEKKHPKVATWLQDIKDVWNGYKAVEQGGARSYDIEFNPVASSSGHHKVKVCKPTKANPNPRSDAGNWYVNDTRKGLAPHEFGHLVGLDDEYNRPEEQYVETTGQEPSVGDLGSATGNAPADVADDIFAALQAPGVGKDRSKAVAKIVDDEGIVPGAYARQVAKQYVTRHPFEVEFHNNIAGSPIPATFTSYLAYRCGRDWTSDLTTATQAFSESNTSIMGTMESVPDGANAATIAGIAPHDHPVQPRHLRSFTDLLVQAMPGSQWKTQKR